MYQINNEKFGQFLSELRKEKSMTQKELADKLFVSDKTVSKWERGNSMPNVTLLIPITAVLLPALCCICISIGGTGLWVRAKYVSTVILIAGLLGATYVVGKKYE